MRQTSLKLDGSNTSQPLHQLAVTCVDPGLESAVTLPRVQEAGEALGRTSHSFARKGGSGFWKGCGQMYLPRAGRGRSAELERETRDSHRWGEELRQEPPGYRADGTKSERTRNAFGRD